MFKKSILLLLCCSLSSISVFAWDEEDACFTLLNEAIINDSRFVDSDIFPDGDLSKVYFEWKNSYGDLTTYDNFKDERAENPNSGNNYFIARRNNIGTIITRNDYVVSQIVGFGRDSNFDFPLKSPDNNSYWDKYKFWWDFFKEYVMYTHHLNRSSEWYPLLSCGVVKVIPLDDRTFSDISEWDYMTNVLVGIKNQEKLWNRKCSSWFEWEKISWENDTDFYQMKANICVQNYAEADYLKMEVISLAYDNGSNYMSEYYTHPLQVEAMLDPANQAGWLRGVQDAFRDKLIDETCFRLIHWNPRPNYCDSWWPTVSTWKGLNLAQLLIPSAQAALDIWDTVMPEEEEESWLLGYGDLPYTLYKKLQSIPDESFREYMLISVLPNFDRIIENKKENNQVLSPFEDTFLSCWLDFIERRSVVEDFLNNLNVDEFSVLNLSYSNKKYWDCIIPYPDKDNIGTVIEWSFSSNQLLAQKLSGNFVEEELSESSLKFAQEREELTQEKNELLLSLEKKFNEWEVTFDEIIAEKEIIQEEYNTKISAIDLEEISELEQGAISDSQEDGITKNTNIKMILFIITCITLWAICIFLVFYKKRNA